MGPRLAILHLISADYNRATILQTSSWSPCTPARSLIANLRVKCLFVCVYLLFSPSLFTLLHGCTVAQYPALPARLLNKTLPRSPRSPSLNIIFRAHATLRLNPFIARSSPLPATNPLSRYSAYSWPSFKFSDTLLHPIVDPRLPPFRDDHAWEDSAYLHQGGG